MSDPVLVWVVRLGLACLFAWAARHKLEDFRAFEATLADYRMLPAGAVRVAALVLPLFELGLALALVVPLVAASVVGAAAIALLALYTLAIGWNLARGRRFIDCGCLGPAGRRPLSVGLVARNVALLGCAAGLLLPVATRPLVWVDVLSIAGGSLLCVLVWVAANGLLEARPPRAFEGSA